MNLISALSSLIFPSHHPTSPFTKWWPQTSRSPSIPGLTISLIEKWASSQMFTQETFSPAHSLAHHRAVLTAPYSMNLSAMCRYIAQKTINTTHSKLPRQWRYRAKSSYLELSVSWWTPYGDEQECEVTISSVPTVQQQLSMYCNLL